MPFGAFMLCASIYSYHFYYIKCQAHQQEVPPSCCWVQRPLLCEFMLSIVFFLWIFSRIPSSAIYPISTFELNSVANKEELETKLDKVLETRLNSSDVATKAPLLDRSSWRLAQKFLALVALFSKQINNIKFISTPNRQKPFLLVLVIFRYP